MITMPYIDPIPGSDLDSLHPSLEPRCYWSHCTARFGSYDQILAHICSLHLAANRYKVEKHTAESDDERECETDNHIHHHHHHHNHLHQNRHQHQHQRQPINSPSHAVKLEFQNAEPVRPVDLDLDEDLDLDVDLSESVPLAPAISQPRVMHLPSLMIPSSPASYPSPSLTDQSPQDASTSCSHALFHHACKWALCALRNFFSLDELIQHITKDHILPPLSPLDEMPLHVCHWKDCDASFSSFDDLTGHVSKHVGSRKSVYICQWAHCLRNQRPFAQRQKIMRHIQTHTGDKPIICPQCHLKFSETSGLQQHLKSAHSTERPHQCSECESKFAIASALKSHMRKSVSLFYSVKI